jgi:GNAT superfamily N-acetyltransferase
MPSKNLEFSEWDSHLLNVNYYKLNNFSLDNFSFIKKEIVNLPNNSMVFTRIDSSKLNYINILVKNEFYISDILTEFRFNTTKELIHESDWVVPIDKDSTYKIQCIKMIQNEFSIGRVHEDENLGIESGMRLYKEWVVNNFIEKFTIAYIKNNTVQGFLQYSFDDNSLRVIFIVTRSDYQNRGVGTALLNSVKNIACINNCSNIIVGTQLKNTNAANFYIKNFFNISKTLIGLNYYAI